MTHPGNDGIPQHAAPQPPFVKRARKFLVGAAGLASQVIAAGVLEENEELWVQAALGVLFAAGIYKVRNAQPSA